MFRCSPSPFKVVALFFGFMSYLILVSPLHLTYKVGLFTLLCIFTCSLTLAIKETDDYWDT